MKGLDARDHAVRAFDAYVLQGNDRLMRVFLDSGFEIEQRLEGGVVHVMLSLEPTARYETLAAERSHAAATSATFLTRSDRRMARGGTICRSAKPA